MVDKDATERCELTLLAHIQDGNTVIKTGRLATRSTNNTSRKAQADNRLRLGHVPFAIGHFDHGPFEPTDTTITIARIYSP